MTDTITPAPQGDWGLRMEQLGKDTLAAIKALAAAPAAQQVTLTAIKTALAKPAGPVVTISATGATNVSATSAPVTAANVTVNTGSAK